MFSFNNNIVRGALERHLDVVNMVLIEIVPDVEGGAQILFEVTKNCKKLLVCGNGGSAADAQHLAGEWLSRYKDDRKPLPAIALTADTSASTAIANDYGFEYIFSRQIEALGNEGDVLVAITTSGKSPNVLKAIKAARGQKMKVIALTGEGGAALKEVCDVAIIVPSLETARIQEMHELICHSWCEYVDLMLREGDFRK